jgi:hypothetical protein
MKRLLVCATLIGACSNGSSTPDGGLDATSEVGQSNDAPSESSGDAIVDAGFTPATLDQAGKLALWLEATSSDLTIADGGVTAWKDKSKNHNDAKALGATPPFVQAGVIAGHDAVHFDTFGSTLGIADSKSLQFATDQTHIVAVAKLSTLRSFFFSKDTSPTDGSVYTGLAFFIANGGGTDASAFSLSPYAAVSGVDSVTWGNGNELADGKFHIIAYRRTDTTHIEVWLDDLTPKTATVPAIDVSAAGVDVVFGPLNGPTTPDMTLAEEVALHDPAGVSDVDVANVHAYLKQKYGL